MKSKSEQPKIPPPPVTASTLPLWMQMLSASVGGQIAEAFTYPLDTAKIRLQIQKVGLGEKPKYKGLFQTIKTITKEEGLGGLYCGILPGILKQYFYASVRIGLYDYFKTKYTPSKYQEAPPMLSKIAAALTSGSLAMLLGNPPEAIKIKLQAHLYPNMFACGKAVIKEKGLCGLYSGFVPNTFRNAIVNACELVTFDTTKSAILKRGLMKDGIAAHFVSSSLAGIVATLVSSPVDVVKTRIISTKGQYKNLLDCFVKTFKNEGFGAFYKGVSVNFMRIYLFNITIFLSMSQIKDYAAVKYNEYNQNKKF